MIHVCVCVRFRCSVNTSNVCSDARAVHDSFVSANDCAEHVRAQHSTESSAEHGANRRTNCEPHKASDICALDVANSRHCVYGF